MSITSCQICGRKNEGSAIRCLHCGSNLSHISGQGQNPTDTFVRKGLSERFDIIGVIGSGGMATVYKAKQKNLSRFVALKVVHPNLVHDHEFLLRFHREAQISASLNHPNIVTVYDVGSINGIHYISMELLEGNDLRVILKSEKQLSTNDLVLTIAPIANALGYAHNRKLVHRDIKSSNIFITTEGRSVLTDFGIAHFDQQTQLTQAGAILGTPDYMSPEQANGVQIDGRSDIFSLGIVMYECLTGKLPFKSENPLSTINAIINRKPTPVSKLNHSTPEWLEKIINNCLAKKTQDRPKNAYEIESRLLNLGRGKMPNESGALQGVGKNRVSLFLSVIAFLLLILLIVTGVLVNQKTGILSLSAKTPTVKTVENTTDSPPPTNEPDTPVIIISDPPLGQGETEDPPGAPTPNDSVDEIQNLLLQANSAFTNNQFSKAIRICQTVLEKQPQNDQAKKIQSQSETALQAIRQWNADKYSENVENADYQYTRENYDSALYYYNKAYNIKPSDSSVLEQINYLNDEQQDLKNQLEDNINKANAAFSDGQLELGFDLLIQVVNDGYKTFEIRNKITETRADLEQIWINDAQNKLVPVEGGTFEMGSDQSSADQRPKHKVTLSSFLIDKTEVTVHEYFRFCKATGMKLPSDPPGGWNLNQPIVNISWSDANAYAAWVGKRLPTEAEWEFAAKGGKKSQGYKYSGSDIASRIACYNKNRPNNTGSKSPNELGLYDMSGNAWEWCHDFYNTGYYTNSPASNPMGPSSGSKRVIRGGSFESQTREIQIKHRGSKSPNAISSEIGFRCAKSN